MVSKLINGASHIPVLSFILNTFDIFNVLEFGMGIYSTRFFLFYEIELFSVETDKIWLNKRYNPDYANHHTFLYDIGTETNVFDAEVKNVNLDLIFIDGAKDSRVECTMKSLGKAPIIVQHDTEYTEYNWDAIILPPEYDRFTYKKHNLWTSIIVNTEANASIFGEFCN